MRNRIDQQRTVKWKRENIGSIEKYDNKTDDFNCKHQLRISTDFVSSVIKFGK